MKPTRSKSSGVWEFFQGLGKTFMLPVALLAFMGLMLGVGSAFSGSATIEAFPWLGNPVLQTFFKFIATIGGFAFTYLPVLFAMAIPLGLPAMRRASPPFPALSAISSCICPSTST